MQLLANVSILAGAMFFLSGIDELEIDACLFKDLQLCYALKNRDVKSMMSCSRV